MYIEPNTVIKVLRNIPWNNTYEDTVMFASQSAQLAYMNTMVKYTFQDQTYNRVNKGVSRVKMKAENLYDCNYMMFQNSNFGTKWFFAFINKVEYINNEVSEIYFEIDEVQTWLFDFEILRCMVEREHSVNDVIGENLLPEPISLGNYVMNEFEGLRTNLITDADTVLVFTTVNDDKSPADGTLQEGVFNGTRIAKFYVKDPLIGADQRTRLNNFLKALTLDNQSDTVVNIVMCARTFEPTSQDSGVERPMLVPTNHYHVDSLDGYIPKNNKLYTYPYSFYYITTGNGNGVPFKFEHFIDPDTKQRVPISFKLIGSSCGVSPQVALVPETYEEGSPYDNMLVLSHYPTCAYSIDSFRAWIAQNKVNLASSVVKNIGMGAIAGLTGSPLAMVGAFRGTLNLATEVGTASLQPPQLKGQITDDALMTAHDLQCFFSYDASVNSVDAQIIDDFFTRFGYATNKLKVPNRDSRPYWNYVKTAGCIIQGTLPADSIKKLCEIHDKGITYWRSGTVVGHYELDNRPNNGGIVNE